MPVKITPRLRPNRDLPASPADLEIQTAISNLHRLERNTHGVNTQASTEPKELPLGVQEKALDSLGRLLVYDEVCAAVHHNGTVLRIASNKASPEYAKRYLPDLKRYIDSPFKETYEVLKQQADKQILFNIRDNYNTTDIIGTLNSFNGRRDVPALKKQLFAQIKSILELEEPRKLILVKDICTQIIKNNLMSYVDRIDAVDILRPIIDTRIIANIFEDYNGLSKEIILAIKNELISYVLGSNNKHSEMKIFDDLVIAFTRPRDLEVKGSDAQHQDDTNQLGHFGIAKLSCWPCNLVLTMSSEKGNVPHWSGTHGGTYPVWEAPSWISNNPNLKGEFLERLGEGAGKYGKWREPYSYRENSIPDEPIFAKFDNIGEVHTRIGILQQDRSVLLDKLPSTNTLKGSDFDQGNIKRLISRYEAGLETPTTTNQVLIQLRASLTKKTGEKKSLLEARLLKDIKKNKPSIDKLDKEMAMIKLQIQDAEKKPTEYDTLKALLTNIATTENLQKAAHKFQQLSDGSLLASPAAGLEYKHGDNAQPESKTPTADLAEPSPHASNSSSSSSSSSSSGTALFDHEDSSPWNIYTTTAMNEILKLRLESTNVKEEEVEIVNPVSAFEETASSAEEIAADISSVESNRKLLVILNLYHKHWVGIVVDKSDGEIKLTYMDSEQFAMPEMLKEKLAEAFTETNPECEISIVEAELEPQKYNNCGLEVIENFIAYLTGYRLSQEDALPFHSALLEDTLLEPEDATMLLGYVDGDSSAYSSFC